MKQPSSPEAPSGGGFWLRSTIVVAALTVGIFVLSGAPAQPPSSDPPPVREVSRDGGPPVAHPATPPVTTPGPPVAPPAAPVIKSPAVPTLPRPAEIVESIYTPDSSVQFALGDIMTIPPQDRHKYRYVSLYNIPRAKRGLYGQTLSFIVNSLGTRRRVYIPVFVGGSDGTVVRINIHDYEWRPADWEKLGLKGSGPKAQSEPYFHILLEKAEDVTEESVKKVKKKRTKVVGKDQFGRSITTEEEYEEDEKTFSVKKGEKKRVSVRAPWLDQNAILELERQTGSEYPIMRCDWFISFASVPPAYYDFLRLGNKQQDFLNLIFADPEKAAKARSQDKAVVVTSTVTRNNRAILRSPTLTGGYFWVTNDSLNSVDDRQYVMNLLNEKFDAQELIGSLPNGLQAYFLNNADLERQDVAPPDIAIDNTAIDRQVRNGRSCIVCHADGLRPIEDEVRSLTKRLQSREQVALLVARDKDAYRVADLFSSDLDRQLVRDMQIYADAVAACNGLNTSQNAKQFGSIYDDYVELLMTKSNAAREVGVSVPELEAYIRMSNDPVLLGLTRNPIRAVRRDQWERSFQGLMLLISTHKRANK